MELSDLMECETCFHCGTVFNTRYVKRETESKGIYEDSKYKCPQCGKWTKLSKEVKE